jgi:hypothetical protein
VVLEIEQRPFSYLTDTGFELSEPVLMKLCSCNKDKMLL